MNDTINGNGMVTSKVLFGMSQRFEIVSIYLLTMKERMEIFEKDQMEINSIISERPVLNDLKRKLSSAADSKYLLGYKVIFSLKYKTSRSEM